MKEIRIVTIRAAAVMRQTAGTAKGGPKKFEFIINVKTAKQIGLMMPSNALAQADKVIK